MKGRKGSAISGSKTDIHPDLTLEKIHNPQDIRRGVLTSFGSRSSRDSKGSRRSSELSVSMKEVLEFNTMFEFEQEKKKKRKSRPKRREGARRSTWETGSRRSSMSVLTMTVKKTEKRKKKYFIRSDVAPQPQSRTAVHYLAISPPRIRITDTSRASSPTGFLTPLQLEKAISNPDLIDGKVHKRKKSSGQLITWLSQNQPHHHPQYSSNESIQGSHQASKQESSASEPSDSRRSSKDSRRSSGDAFLPQSRSQSNSNAEELRQAVMWATKRAMAASTILRHNIESTTTASTSSSGPQNSGVSGSNYSQESKRSGSSRQYSTNTRSSSSASSSYILDYGNSSEKSSFDIDSRRSSGEGAYSSQPPSSILSNKQFVENMSPISEISTCSTMQERRGSLNLQLNKLFQDTKLKKTSPHNRTKVRSHSMLKIRTPSPSLATQCSTSKLKTGSLQS